MQVPSAEAVIDALHARKWATFDGVARRGFRHEPDLNLVGLRAVPGTVDAFDDLVAAVWCDLTGIWKIEAFRATLDPGKPSLDNPKRADGTADMAVAQTRGAFGFGTHHPGTSGAYRCLVPRVPIPVYRYKSAGDFTSGNGGLSTSTTTQIHHANGQHPSTIVGAWSEGCAVLADPTEFARLLALCDRQVAAGLGDTFTWSVLPWQG